MNPDMNAWRKAIIERDEQIRAFKQADQLKDTYVEVMSEILDKLGLQVPDGLEPEGALRFLQLVNSNLTAGDALESAVNSAQIALGMKAAVNRRPSRPNTRPAGRKA